MKPTNKDWYESFEALSASELEGVDFRIVVTARPSSVAIVAPHGGHIEPHTSEIAAAIAAEDFSLYLFEGPRSGRHHRELHVTSDRFAEPRALALVQGAQMVLGVHGRENKDDGETVWVGGLDFASRDRIVAALIGAGFAAVARQPGQTLAGAARNNICNRCKIRKGVQLEIPRTLRDRLGGDAVLMTTLAEAVARAIGVT
ncbi:poly-gamma-glutamate hydrolase family protein [Rhizobium leguminosarum]|uniref:poly-gamma-glutamate hydrolase family protein n=1 Tax=Rhizobium leguminosarum TaxID=384 RepID=UPI003D0769C6